MMARFFKKWVLISCGLLYPIALLTSCGGGGATVADGGIGGSGIFSAGTITAIGSITVNGVRYTTSGAQLLREGEDPVTLDDTAAPLVEGMVVTVEGEVADDGVNGTAERIRFEDILEGPIANVAEVSPGLVKTLEILGQTVVVENGVTRFDDRVPGSQFDFDTLSIGLVAEVSGFHRPDGTIQATFISRTAQDLDEFFGLGHELEVKGAVDGLPSAATMRINNLLVDFSSAPPRNMPAGGLEPGLIVEVKGGPSSLLPDGTLVATDLEVKPRGLGLDNHGKVEIEGFLAGLDSTAKTFQINGQPVSYGAAAFDGGVEADLVNGLKIEAEGPVTGGVLQAVRIKFRESIRIEANVDVVDGAAGTFTLQGLPGITVKIDAQLTSFRNGDLGQVQPGRHLKIRGRLPGPSGIATMTLVATRIEIQDPRNEISLQGPVSNINDPAFEILGIRVDSTSIADPTGFKSEEVVIGREAFFAALAEGVVVKAQGNLSSIQPPSINWTEAELEED